LTRSFVAAHKRAFVAIVPALLALGICAYQLSLPNVLFGVHGITGDGYDDGVYLGVATRLVHGVLPYRDFVFVHPPGIALLMSPLAALGRVIGTRDALVIARLVTAGVTALNAALAALAVRHRGPGAMAVAGTALACFPLAVAADQTLLLEPYLVCFCLLGTIAVFSGGAIGGRRRVFLGGIAFGFAGAVKIWAILPIVVAVLICLPRWKTAVRPIVVGITLGFAVPCLPFFLAAPHAFLHDVFADQLTRAAPGAGSPTFASRLLLMTGLTGLHAVVGLAVCCAIGFVVFVALVYGGLFGSSTRLDWFLLGSAVVVTTAMFFSTALYDHYVYFPAAFIAMVFGSCVARGLEAMGRAVPLVQRFGDLALPGALALVAAAILLPQQASYARAYLSSAEDPSTILDRAIPPGACVTADQITFAIDADRFNPATRDCPAVLDPFGMWVADLPEHLPPSPGPYSEKFVELWGKWLNETNDVVLVAPMSDYIPWSAGLSAWFDDSFRIVYSRPGLFVYRHVRHASLASVVRIDAADQLVSQGLAAEGAGHLHRAFADYEAATNKDPDNQYAHYDLGYIDQQRKETSKASAEYTEALRIDPTFADALYNMGVLEAPTDPAGAIEFYKRDLGVDPRNASANFNLGVLLIRQGETALGDLYLETGLSLNPSLRSSIPPGITVPSATTGES
jgi:hypothetical protein